MHRAAGLDWMHKPTVLSGLGAAARDESLLRYWGLTEEERGLRRDDGGRAGFWRVTSLGSEFARGLTRVPKYALVYDSRCLGLDGAEFVDIREALGDRFDYDELMAGR